MLADQDGLKPFFHQLLTSPCHCVRAGIEGRRNLAVTPSFTSFRSRCISVICGAIDSEIVRKINDGRY